MLTNTTPSTNPSCRSSLIQAIGSTRSAIDDLEEDDDQDWGDWDDESEAASYVLESARYAGLTLKELEAELAGARRELALAERDAAERERLELEEKIRELTSELEYLLSWRTRWEELTSSDVERITRNLRVLARNLEILTELRPSAVPEIDPEEFLREFQRAVRSSQVRRRIQFELLMIVVGARESASAEVIGAQEAACTDALKHEVLIETAFTLAAAYDPLRIGTHPRLYRVPVMTLTLTMLDLYEQVIPMGDLEESDLETISVLFGTDAYRTLESARDAAVALRN